MGDTWVSNGSVSSGGVDWIEIGGWYGVDTNGVRSQLDPSSEQRLSIASGQRNGHLAFLQSISTGECSPENLGLTRGASLNSRLAPLSSARACHFLPLRSCGVCHCQCLFYHLTVALAAASSCSLLQHLPRDCCPPRSGVQGVIT